MFVVVVFFLIYGVEVFFKVQYVRYLIPVICVIITLRALKLFYNSGFTGSGSVQGFFVTNFKIYNRIFVDK
jgi:hypothetical protein